MNDTNIDLKLLRDLGAIQSSRLTDLEATALRVMRPVVDHLAQEAGVNADQGAFEGILLTAACSIVVSLMTEGLQLRWKYRSFTDRLEEVKNFFP